MDNTDYLIIMAPGIYEAANEDFVLRVDEMVDMDECDDLSEFYKSQVVMAGQLGKVILKLVNQWGGGVIGD